MATWVNFKELRKHLNFESVLRHYNVEIKAKGDQHHGFCPLPTHQGEKRSASFSANLAKGIFQCFGCKAKGNLIDFAVCMEKLDPEKGEDVRAVALKLQERFCPTLVQPKKEQKPTPAPVESKPEEEKKEAELPSVVNAPLDFTLKQLQADHSYLSGRGFTAETIARFGLGFCARGYLKDRIAIPLHDDGGQLVGYAGRLVDDAAITPDNPKYLFPSSREREGVRHEFKKSLFVYNGHGITSPAPHLIVVEGFPALWWCHQAGVSHVVATMGASCSEVQAELIVKKVTPSGTVWILSDGDEAGARQETEVFARVAPHRAVRLIRSPDGKQPTDWSAEELRSLVSAPAVASTPKRDSRSIKARLIMRELMPRKAILELAESFPYLASLRLGEPEWDAAKLDAMTGKLSSGERAMIQFLLHVWNPFQTGQSGKFDIGALDTWDDAHRQAFARWAADPWWC